MHFLSLFEDMGFMYIRSGPLELIRIVNSIFPIHPTPWLLPLTPHPSRVTQSSGRETMTVLLQLPCSRRELPTRLVRAFRCFLFFFFLST